MLSRRPAAVASHHAQDWRLHPQCQAVAMLLFYSIMSPAAVQAGTSAPVQFGRGLLRVRLSRGNSRTLRATRTLAAWGAEVLDSAGLDSRAGTRHFTGQARRAAGLLRPAGRARLEGAAGRQRRARGLPAGRATPTSASAPNALLDRTPSTPVGDDARGVRPGRGLGDVALTRSCSAPPASRLPRAPMGSPAHGRRGLSITPPATSPRPRRCLRWACSAAPRSVRLSLAGPRACGNG